MSEKILVVYATRAGSTREIAEAVAKALSEQGQEVGLRPLQEVSNLGSYASVVVGSGVRIFRLYAEAVDFVKRNRAALQKVPVAFFLSCMTMKEDNEKNRETALRFLQPLTSLVPPAAVGLFAGKVDPSTMRGLAGRMMKKPRRKIAGIGRRSGPGRPACRRSSQNAGRVPANRLRLVCRLALER